MSHSREYQLEHYRSIFISEQEIADNDPQNVPRYVCISKGPWDIRLKLRAMLIRERAGICAIDLEGDPQRSNSENGFALWVDVPSPEGLLLP